MAQERILIIEDEKALADILEYNLVREGYQVFTANDGVEGLEKAQPLSLTWLSSILCCPPWMVCRSAVSCEVIPTLRILVF